LIKKKALQYFENLEGLDGKKNLHRPRKDFLRNQVPSKKIFCILRIFFSNYNFMIKISREFKVGVLALVSMVLLYSGFNYLKGKDFFAGSHYYYAVYDDVQGLAAANLVRVNGVTVGRVLDVRFLQNSKNPKLNGKVLVTIDLSQKINMGKNTKALITNSLLSGTSIDLQLDMQEPFLQYDDTLKTGVSKDLMASVQEQATPVINKVDSALAQINSLMAEFKGVGTTTHSTLKTFEESAKILNQMLLANDKNLAAITANANQLTANLNETSKKMPDVLKKIDTFADSLQKLNFSKTLNNANQTLAELNALLDKLNKSDGTMNALIKDKTLYENLTRVTADLDKLLIDLRQNPQRYLRLRL
jgi:phospholipid/cholesterol/gamma-HCH transport system substrate-binding protein